MKESTGGALLMGLAAGIIIIFIIMVAFFISYGKTFRLKNEVINKIEQGEGLSKNEIESILISKNYHGKTAEYCINKITNHAGNEFIGFTINVTVYMSMDRTILGSAFKVDIPISGETRIIEKGWLYDFIKAHYGSTSYYSIPVCP